MPNLRGGKAYKKGKGKTADDDEKDVFIDKQADQMIGRLVRLLGNRNTTVYCEDKVTRQCRISTGCKKSTRFEVGDVVLLSLRDCDVSTSDLAKGVRADRGDILAKYNPLQFAQLKKEGVNSQIFSAIDTVNAMATAAAAGGKEEDIDAIANANDAMEDFFETEKSPTNELVQVAQKLETQLSEDDDLDIDRI
jgi:initiation factor 1A